VDDINRFIRSGAVVLQTSDEMDGASVSTELTDYPSELINPAINPATLALTVINPETMSSSADESVSSTDRLGNNPILLVSPALPNRSVKEQNAAESIPHNPFYELHLRLGMSFDFPAYFQQELTLEPPFSLRYTNPLKKVDPKEAEPSPSRGTADNSLLDLFFRKVHTWFPFLDPDHCRAEFVDIKPVFTSKYCMYLLMLSLGKMARNDRLTNRPKWPEKYSQPAFSMLSIVSVENNITSVHCLILFSYCVSCRS
jgi:hypothetical protein